MNQQGFATAQFGQDLTRELGARYVVYYDHGDPEKHANVAACKAFHGTLEEGVRNNNRLADVDVLIADSEGRALVLVEIEERPSSPKKILGDIFALAMSNYVAVGRGDQQTFTVGAHTHLVVAGVLPQEGALLDLHGPGHLPEGGGPVPVGRSPRRLMAGSRWRVGNGRGLRGAGRRPWVWSGGPSVSLWPV